MRILRWLLALAAFSVPLHADTLLVANRGGSTITLIDPATMTLLGTVGVGFDPHEIAVSADGSRAYVSNMEGKNGGADLRPSVRMARPWSASPLRITAGGQSVLLQHWTNSHRRRHFTSG